MLSLLLGMTLEEISTIETVSRNVFLENTDNSKLVQDYGYYSTEFHTKK